MTAHEPGSSPVDSGGFALSGHTGRGWESWGCLCGRGEGVRGPYQCVQILDGRSEEERARLLAAVLSGEAVGTPRCKKFHWNVRNASSTVIEPRSKLLQRLWSLCPWRCSKPDHWSPSLLWVTHLWAVGWTTWSPEMPANLNPPVEKNTAVWNGGDTKQAKFCNLLKYFFQQWHCQYKSCLLHVWMKLPGVYLSTSGHLLPKGSLWSNMPVM